MPAPMRSLLAHFPDELGLALMQVTIDGDASSRSTPATTILRRSAPPARGVPTLCFDERQAPFGACRVCLVGVEGAPRAAAGVHDAVPRRAW